MVLSWSITEVIRYTHFALTQLGYEAHILLWLRYTTFYILYPTGASSEAFCMLVTILSAKSWDFWGLVRGGLFVIWWPGMCYPSSVTGPVDVDISLCTRSVCYVHAHGQEEGKSTRRQELQVKVRLDYHTLLCR